VKKDVNPKWRPRNGCDGRLKAKILIMTIWCRIIVKRGEDNTELSLLKFHSHFLAATLDFTSFFTTVAAHFFLQLGYFGLDQISATTI